MAHMTEVTGVPPQTLMKKLLLLSALVLGTASAQSTLRLLAPATKGGGYDTLAQNIATSLTTEKLVPNVSVYNIPGEGGVVGLREFVKSKGDPSQLVVFGFTTLGSLNLSDAPGLTLADLTPIARLTTDYEVVVVPASSPYKTLADVVNAFKGGSRVRFGGASLGSADHLFLSAILGAGRPLTWVESSGNLQALKAMYQNELDVASVSYGVANDDLKAGKLRALAISAPQRLDGVKIPTAKEQGYDAELTNWRGVFGPAGLSQAEVNRLSLLLTKMSRTATWRGLLKDQKQQSYYQSAVSFKYFVYRENDRAAKLLKDAGLKK